MMAWPNRLMKLAGRQPASRGLPLRGGVSRPRLGGLCPIHHSLPPIAPHQEVPGQRRVDFAMVFTSRRLLARPKVAWTLGIAGLLAYNWWILVPLRPGLMHSPNELFSNLEVSGQPLATAMQHADLLSGLLLLGAFLVVGSRSIPDARRESLAMMAFAATAALGGIFPEMCADETNAVCRKMEWTFRLPLDQYLHIVAGIVEFGGITAALLFAFQRTRGEQTHSATVYRILTRGAFGAYAFLGLAYVLDRLGGIVEAIFFLAFTIMVLVQLFERIDSLRVNEHRERQR